MALTLPTAPKNFYEPSLQGLKDALEAVNGSSSGTITLLKTIPTTADTAWAEAGAGNHEIETPANFGTEVIGSGPMGDISAILAGPEESVGESGYKLTIGVTPEILVYIDGTGVTTATGIAACLIVGRDTFAEGSDLDIRYMLPIDNLLVRDGQIVSFKEFEILINYSETDEII